MTQRRQTSGPRDEKAGEPVASRTKQCVFQSRNAQLSHTHSFVVNFAIMCEPSGWVKSVTANKAVNYPRFQLSQALFSVIFQ